MTCVKNTATLRQSVQILLICNLLLNSESEYLLLPMQQIWSIFHLRHFFPKPDVWLLPGYLVCLNSEKMSIAMRGLFVAQERSANISNNEYLLMSQPSILSYVKCAMFA